MKVPPGSASGLRLAMDGDTLVCSTDSAEAADHVWQNRHAWLRFWPAARLRLTWASPEGHAQLDCDRLAGPERLLS